MMEKWPSRYWTKKSSGFKFDAHSKPADIATGLPSRLTLSRLRAVFVSKTTQKFDCPYKTVCIFSLPMFRSTTICSLKSSHSVVFQTGFSLLWINLVEKMCWLPDHRWNRRKRLEKAIAMWSWTKEIVILEVMVAKGMEMVAVHLLLRLVRYVYPTKRTNENYFVDDLYHSL